MSRELNIADFALELLFNAGHATCLAPIYKNHDMNRFMYADSNIFVALNGEERLYIDRASDISLLFCLEDELFEQHGTKIDFYAVTLNCLKIERSAAACLLHKIIHKHTGCRYSIVVFSCDDQFVFSMADGKGYVYLSDWYSFEEDNEFVVNAIDIANTSLRSPREFFYDFVAAIATPYYFNTISIEYAMYVIYPSQNQEYDELGTFLKSNRDGVKEVIRGIISEKERLYGDDYIEPYPLGHVKEDAKEFIDISAEIDQMIFELELAEEENESEFFDDNYFEDDDSLDEMPYDDFDYDGMPQDVFDDPIKMVKWLEAKEAEKNAAIGEKVDIEDFNDLGSFFQAKGFEVMDKRHKGGCLWVVGSKQELEKYVDLLRNNYGIEGTFGSGKATKHRLGWYTTWPY